ncbi:MAG TPA: phosphotransferase [Vicinamibacterales bacterium]|nr:phosphotransferase [Vicinamibacterales bacterium]
MAEWSAEITVGPDLARRLIREQFGHLPTERLRPLGSGWDNTVYLVDEVWVFRFPRREIAVAGVEREIAVLPQLTALPLPIPTPRFIGTNSSHYPWPFFGAGYVAGNELADVRLDDEGRAMLGAVLGRFLRSLHDPARLPSLADILPVDPNRRSDMGYRVERTRERLAEIERIGLWAIPSSLAPVLSSARDLPSVPPTVVAHGDLHIRHLLITADARPAGVIDWGDVCRADPSIDLSLYWSLLSPLGREALRDAYGPVSEEQLLRARVLSLFINATLALYAHDEGLDALECEALIGLQRTMLD